MASVRLRYLLFLLFLALCPPGWAETVNVYTNATFPPLVIDAKLGLYPELVEYLNGQKDTDLEFVLETLPRKRLQALLEGGNLDGIIIGMMPQWFDDPDQTRYLWTEPFFYDSFVLVSDTRNPVFFSQTDTMGRLKIGVTFGYVYPGIDEWLSRHKFVRDEAPTEERNLDKLMLGRVDAVIVAESVLRYYTKTHRMSAGIVIESLPGQQTERRFLVPKAKQQVFDKLAPLIRKLNADPNWRRIQSAY